MSSPVPPGLAHPTRLFAASCLALIVTAMSFAIRGDIMPALGHQFSLSNEELGWVAGTAFWGFTLAMLVGGPLCDALGMGRLVAAAAVGHLLGVLVTIFSGGFWSLFAGTLLIGIANGFVEAACNPLIATLYPEEKTKKLNQFHVWFPGGIVIGGLVALGLTAAHLGWQWKMACLLVPWVAYVAMFWGHRFPRTERVASGVSTGEMWRECLRPLFLFMVFCMCLTAVTELGPNQWMPSLFKASGLPGILILVWVTALMALGRQFAGLIVHKLAPTGMLLFSSVFAALGLFALSQERGPVFTFLAATIFAVGVCYFWPTMLAFVSERAPRTGALGLAVMGGAGMLASGIAQPLIGHIFDYESHRSMATAAQVTVRWVAILPVVLIVAFGALWVADRRRGGYRRASLSE